MLNIELLRAKEYYKVSIFGRSDETVFDYDHAQPLRLEQMREISAISNSSIVSVVSMVKSELLVKEHCLTLY